MPMSEKGIGKVRVCHIKKKRLKNIPAHIQNPFFFLHSHNLDSRYQNVIISERPPYTQIKTNWIP